MSKMFLKYWLYFVPVIFHCDYELFQERFFFTYILTGIPYITKIFKLKMKTLN